MSVPHSQFKSDGIEGELVWAPLGELSSPLDGSDMKQLTAIGGNNLFLRSLSWSTVLP